MLVKFYARRDLKRCIRRGEQYIQLLSNSDEEVDLNQVHRWRERCVDVVRRWFGEDHFLAVQVGRQTVGPLFTVLDGHEDLLEGQRERRQSYVSSVGVIVNLLKDSLGEIKEIGLIKYRVANLVSNLVLTVLILGLMWQIVSWMIDRSGETAHNSTVESSQERYKVTEVEFNHWYKYLRTEYRYGLDTVLQNVIEERGGRFSPGVLAKRQIAFAENFERQIEKTLDSFLVEYTIQGGDTSNLNYKKKPLGYLSSDLRNALLKRR